MPFLFRRAVLFLASTLLFATLLIPSSGLAQKIVFQSQQENNNYEIFTMDADGSNQVNLTNDTGSDTRPFWSPDGTKIVFSSNRIDSEEIYVMDADGGNLTRLTNNLAVDRPYGWSPDGLRILFLSTRDSNSEVYMMTVDGNDVVRVTDDPASDQPYQFSPDGSRILFTSNRSGNTDIYTVPVDGGPPVNLTPESGIDTTPHWSPDGSRIVFSSDRAGIGSPDVYSMNATTGGDVVRLTELAMGPAVVPENGREQSFFLSTSPHYSPDGSQILFRADVLGGTGRSS